MTEAISPPSFTIHDLPLTDEQLQVRETWMMESGNWRGDHSVPSVGGHYPYMWKWDSLKAVVINARRDDPDRARTEIETLERYRDPSTGFLSNKIFATAGGSKSWRDYPEAWNFNNNKIGSSYSQPSLGAWAAMETYISFKRLGREDEGLQFLEGMYGTAEEGNYTGLQGEHAYFINHRQNSPDDSLIGIVHPNETGRDSDEANKPWLVYGDKKGRQDPKLEWLRMQKLGYVLGRLGADPQKQRIDWIPEQVRPEYWVNDVMFNAMHANNMRYLADIASLLAMHASTPAKREQYTQDIDKYQSLAAGVEKEILDRMWDKERGFFYNLDSSGNKIPVESITGLFPLLLSGINKEQTAALVEKLEDERWFATQYPIPTHAVCSDFYDPDPGEFKKTFTPPWSGTAWISPNVVIVEEGLVPRAEALADPNHASYDPTLARRALGAAGIIAAKTRELLAINPKSMECYTATTGEGLRVEDFMWSNLGLHFDNLNAAQGIT